MQYVTVDPVRHSRTEGPKQSGEIALFSAILLGKNVCELFSKQGPDLRTDQFTHPASVLSPVYLARNPLPTSSDFAITYLFTLDSEPFT
jgi:hypothetical protein